MRSFRQFDLKKEKTESKSDHSTSLIKQDLLPNILDFPVNSSFGPFLYHHRFILLADLMLIAPSSDHGHDYKSIVLDIENLNDYYEINVHRPFDNVRYSGPCYSYAITPYKENKHFAILPVNANRIEIHDFQKKACVKVVGAFKHAIQIAYSKNQDQFIVVFANHLEVWDVQKNKKITNVKLPTTCESCVLKFSGNDYLVAMLRHETAYTLLALDLHSYKLSTIQTIGKQLWATNFDVLAQHRIAYLFLADGNGFTHLKLRVLKIKEQNLSLSLHEEFISPTIEISYKKLSVSPSGDVLLLMDSLRLEFYKISPDLDLDEPYFSYKNKTHHTDYQFNWLPDDTLVIHQKHQPILIDTLNKCTVQHNLASYHEDSHSQTLADGRLMFINPDSNVFQYEFNHLEKLRKQLEFILYKVFDDIIAFMPNLASPFPSVLSEIIAGYAVDFSIQDSVARNSNSFWANQQKSNGASALHSVANKGLQL